MLNVKLDTSPLTNGHGGRGIGMYTRSLSAALQNRSDIKLISQNQTDDVPDIVHYPFFDLFFATLPLKKKYPTVVTIHDVIPLMYPKEYQPGIKGTARFYTQRLALRNVKAVITDSDFSKTQIEKYLHLKSEVIHVIHLAADERMLKPSPAKIKEVTQHLKLPSKYLLYVGDINYNKNIPQLIKTLKFLPEEIELVCVGANFKPQAIPEWQWIETQMAMSDVANRVHFFPDIPIGDFETMSAVYSGSVAYIQPSLAEGFGLPLLEAMQCQTPVVSARTTSLPEVGGEFALYAEPEAEAFAEQISQVLSWSDTKRSRWTREAHEWAHHFSWSKVADETVAVYAKVANLT